MAERFYAAALGFGLSVAIVLGGAHLIGWLTTEVPATLPAVIITGPEAHVDPDVDTSRITVDDPVEQVLPVPIPLPVAPPELLPPAVQPPAAPQQVKPPPAINPPRRAMRPRHRLPPRVRVARLLSVVSDWRETIWHPSR